MKWLIGVVLLAALFILGVSFYLQPNNFYGCNTQPVAGTECKKVDAIVVVSGGDTQGRTAAGIELYKNGWANSLVLSGAARDKSGISNAAAMQEQAISAGIPADAIYIDEKAETTTQNAINTQEIFQKNNFNEVILVTSGYHQRRASLEFEKQTQNVTIYNHPVTQDKDWGWYWWLTPRGWWLAGGELVKIIAFYAGVTS